MNQKNQRSSAAEPEPEESDQGVLRWFGPLLVAVAAGAMALWTWGRWPDVLVDFGREVYAPWRLSEGAALYRDVAWFNGPLSVYWNALWFWIFGSSLAVLFAVNLALFGLFLVLVYRLMLRLADGVVATAACLVVVALFGFGQLVGIGNYNFIAPYSHEATHGLMLGLAAVAMIGRWARARNANWLVASGFFAGLAMLTKPEMALAALIAPTVAVALSGRLAPVIGEYGRAMLLFAAGAIFPLLIALLGLTAFFGWSVALEGVSAPWRGLLAGETAALPFYRASMGLDRPAENLESLALVALTWLAVLAPAVAAAFLCRSETWRWRTPALAVFALYAVVLVVLSGWIHWLAAAKPLPLVALAATGIALGSRERDPERSPLLMAFAVFALLLLGKMILNPRVQHYGFVLALPATLLAVLLVAHWIPALVGRFGGRAELVRAAALGVLLAACMAHVLVTAKYRALKTVRVGAGGDAFWADVRGGFVQQALAELERTPADAKLVVLPEGVMLNYLARRANPTPYVNFMPPELLLFGEEAILARLRAHPPEVVALVHKDTSEYGAPLFGRDYGQALAAWISETYRPQQLFGDPPLEPGSVMGIALLAKP